MPRLSQLATCSGCALYKLGSGFSALEGTGSNKVMLVGEALGENEENDGLPFRPYAQAGSVLERALRYAGAPRDQFVITNVVRCRPSIRNELAGMWYEHEAINHCKQYLDAAIRQHQPKVIVALGGVAARTLTGLSGKKLGVEDLQGYVLPAINYPGVWVIPTYHPSFIARGQFNVFPCLFNAIRRAVAIAKLEKFEHAPVSYYPDASVEEVEDFYQDALVHPNLPISFDWETTIEDDVVDPEALLIEDEEGGTKGTISTDQIITQVNLSLREREGISFPFTPEMRPLVQKIMGSSNDKVTYNGWCFDLPVAVYNGITVTGIVHDVMWQMHHFYPDLPGKKGKSGGADKETGSLMNLQYAASFVQFPWPWKHLSGSHPGIYGCADSDSCLRVFNWSRTQLQEMDLWDGYQRLVMDTQPILKEMQDRGIPFNIAKAREFVKYLLGKQEEVLGKIQPFIPREIMPTKHKKGLKKPPKDTTGHELRMFQLEGPEPCSCFRKRSIPCVACGGNKKGCEKCKKGKVSLKCADPQCPYCKGQGFLVGKIERWCKLEQFKPTSPVQLKAYASFKHHQIPRNSKKEIAMDKETLNRMAKKYSDPVYSLSIDFKEVVKMRGTYGEGWLRAALKHQDNRVRTQFTYAPATLQLSSVAPNVQTAPNVVKYGELAEMFRGCIEAPPGYVLVEYDWRSFHAQTLGLAAGDVSYIRLARMDVHSYVAAHMLRIPEANGALNWSDSDLRAWLKIIKKQHQKVRDKQAKPACIAEGQLVLTHLGLIPIEQVSTNHLLWDGVEWVEHYGVVYQGVREVIEYEGIKATADHKVFGRSGETCTFGESASTLDRLLRSASEGEAVRVCCSDKLQAYANQRILDAHVQMQDLWSSQASGQGQFDGRENRGLSILRSKEILDCKGENHCSPLGANLGQVHQSRQQKLPKLRRSWDFGELQECGGIRQVGVEEPSTQGLRGSRNRPERQQRWVQAREFETVHAAREHQQSNEHADGSLARGVNPIGVLGQSVRSELDETASYERIDWGTSNRARSGVDQGTVLQDSKENNRVAGRSRVYDILNAGPRLCFTVINSDGMGFVFANCLGIGFGLMGGKLFRMNMYDPETGAGFRTEREADEVIEIIEREFPITARFRKDIPLVAHKQHYLKNDFGAIRWFWDVRRYDFQHKMWKHGDDNERAIAYLPASNAFGMVREVMRILFDLGMTKEYGLINTVHDSLLFCCRRELVQKCVRDVKGIMEAPSSVLKMPDGGPFGVEVEVKVGSNWADMEEVKG